MNGVATSSAGLQLIVDYLHKAFGRAVIGVHNRTFGIWFDVIEFIIQRDLSWPTTDVRVGYEVSSSVAYQELADHIGHQQGYPRPGQEACRHYGSLTRRSYRIHLGGTYPYNGHP